MNRIMMKPIIVCEDILRPSVKLCISSIDNRVPREKHQILCNQWKYLEYFRQCRVLIHREGTDLEAGTVWRDAEGLVLFPHVSRSKLPVAAQDVTVTDIACQREVGVVAFLQDFPDGGVEVSANVGEERVLQEASSPRDGQGIVLRTAKSFLCFQRVGNSCGSEIWDHRRLLLWWLLGVAWDTGCYSLGLVLVDLLLMASCGFAFLLLGCVGRSLARRRFLRNSRGRRGSWAVNFCIVRFLDANGDDSRLLLCFSLLLV